MRRWQLDAKGMDEYLKSIQKTPEELREELRPVAIRGLKQSLVLTEVARQEDIKIESDDIKNEVESMTKYIPEDQKEKMLEYLMMPQSQVSIASTIATQRTINRLTEIAQSAAETESSTESAEAKEEGKEETSKAETKAEEAEEPEAKQEEAK